MDSLIVCTWFISSSLILLVTALYSGDVQCTVMFLLVVILFRILLSDFEIECELITLFCHMPSIKFCISIIHIR